MTYGERTSQLLTVKFALEHGYKPRIGNATARKHFYFTYQGVGSPDVDVSWFENNRATVTVGDTTTDDAHALQLLKRYW